MRLVLCHGCFDILHIGHLWHFKEALSMGDKLCVSITSDRFITKPGRPIFNELQRMEMLLSLREIDAVYLADYETGAEMIETLKPTIFCKGPDYLNGIDERERIACEKVKAQIRYTTARKYSSTTLVGVLNPS